MGQQRGLGVAEQLWKRQPVVGRLREAVVAEEAAVVEEAAAAVELQPLAGAPAEVPFSNTMELPCSSRSDGNLGEGNRQTDRPTD